MLGYLLLTQSVTNTQNTKTIHASHVPLSTLLDCPYRHTVIALKAFKSLIQFSGPVVKSIGRLFIVNTIPQLDHKDVLHAANPILDHLCLLLLYRNDLPSAVIIWNWKAGGMEWREKENSFPNLFPC